MRKTILSFLFAFSVIFAKAQQDYKAFLETLFQHSENDFKDIAEKENDSTTYRESKLKPEMGEIKISIMPYGANLNWIVPLDKSEKLQKDIEDFIKTKFANHKEFAVAKSDDLDDENFITTNVYRKNGERKPKLLLQTFYYKDNEDKRKSNFSIIIYGK